MLTPEAQAQIDAHRGRQTAGARGERPLVDDSRYTAHTIGLVAEIVPGVEIWTVENGRRNWHGEPLGGIVLHVDAGGPPTVNDDGEIVEHQARFRCYDPLAPWPHKAFLWVSEDEIDRDSIAAAHPTSLTTAVRRFCRLVGSSNARTLDGHDAQLVTDAHRLVTVIMGGGSR